MLIMKFIDKYAKIDGENDSDDQMSAERGDEVNYPDVEFCKCSVPENFISDYVKEVEYKFEQI